MNYHLKWNISTESELNNKWVTFFRYSNYIRILTKLSTSKGIKFLYNNIIIGYIYIATITLKVLNYVNWLWKISITQLFVPLSESILTISHSCFFDFVWYCIPHKSTSEIFNYQLFCVILFSLNFRIIDSVRYGGCHSTYCSECSQ